MIKNVDIGGNRMQILPPIIRILKVGLQSSTCKKIFFLQKKYEKVIKIKRIP